MKGIIKVEMLNRQMETQGRHLLGRKIRLGLSMEWSAGNTCIVSRTAAPRRRAEDSIRMTVLIFLPL